MGRSQRRIYRATIVVAALAAVGCENPLSEQRAAEPMLSVSPARDSGRRLNWDDRLAAIADTVPGFAGFYYEGDQLIARVKPGGAGTNEVRDAVGRFLERGARGVPEVADARRVEAQSLTVVQAEFDFRELHTWYRGVRGPLMRRSWISRAGINERENRIVIGIGEEGNVEAAARLVAEAGIPPAAVRVIHRPWPSLSADSLTGVNNPRVGGVQVHDGVLACTLGFNVDRSSDNNWYFTTAGHCVPPIGESKGDDLYQPLWPSNKIGDEVAQAPTWTSSTDSLCPATYDCMDADIALIKYSSSTYKHGEVAWPASEGAKTYTTTEQIGAAYSPAMGKSLHLVGRVSGRQDGEVTGTCDDIDFAMDKEKVYCIWTGDYDEANGDSGGPVFGFQVPYRFPYVAYGTHIGGDATDSFFNGTDQWIDVLETEYGNTLCLTVFCSPSPSVSMTGPSIVPGFVSCSWSASASGGVPPYSYAWSGVASGSGSGLQATVNSSGLLYVTVTDDVSHTRQTSKYIVVDSNEPTPPECSW